MVDILNTYKFYLLQVMSFQCFTFASQGMNHPIFEKSSYLHSAAHSGKRRPRTGHTSLKLLKNQKPPFPNEKSIF